MSGLFKVRPRHRMPRMQNVVLASVMTLLAACASPQQHDVDAYRSGLAATAVSAEFSGTLQATDESTPAPQLSAGELVADWWQTLDDSLLTGLIDQAMQHNHDVRIAMQNLELARIGYDAERLNYLPNTNVGVDGSRQRLADANALPSAENPFTSYSSGFDASWEVDLFGRVRNAVAAANAELDASQAELDGVYVTLAAEVAARYIELRGLQLRRDVNQRSADNLEQSYTLTEQLRTAGMGDALDVQRALTQWELVRATIPTLDEQIDLNIRRLSVLTGQLPSTLLYDLAEVQSLPSIPASVNVGDPVSLMQRRPDIRRAEHQLSAAISRYQVSVSDLYPRISISGSIGFLATRFADLGTGGTLNYLFGPRISWDAFDMGRVQNRINAQDTRVQAQLLQFEKILLLSLEEVDNSMSALTREGERHNRLRAAAEASARASNLAQLRFEVGSDSFLDVLDAQRTQLQAEDLLAQSETDLALDVVSLYKALGGGWQ